uniref:ORF34 n=1 Tax=Human herpesvirus 8 TaxID=37296 RepID=A0A0N9SM30_HHV8|nr:ORF34 [Human gammaherpesvirus 8]
MFALSSLVSEGDPEVTSRYVKGVQLALDLSENTPGQFKLIETPLNSFLLVSNVMPEVQPICSGRPALRPDFSNLHLPRLEKLQRVLGQGFGAAGEEIALDPSHVETHEKGQVFYNNYATEEWTWALTLNKDALLREAVDGLCDPGTWKGLLPDDPLPLLWLLFNGPASFCRADCCLYKQHCGYPGPVLLPGHMYAPKRDLLSFVNHALKYTKFLYGDFSGTWAASCRPPFATSRIQRVVSQMKIIDASDTYISHTCLLCHIYQQNSIIAGQGTHVGGILLLSGKGTQYITGNVQTQRCPTTGDYLIIPSYDIPAIITMIKENGLNQL